MIRYANFLDFERIYELGSILHPKYRITYDLSELSTKEYFKILVYVEHGLVVGFLMFTELGDTIDVLDIVVDPQYRKKKVGSNLMDYMITNSTPGGKIYLEVAVDNHIAIDLYTKMKFKIINTRKKYYGEKDAYVMERENIDD